MAARGTLQYCCCPYAPLLPQWVLVPIAATLEVAAVETDPKLQKHCVFATKQTELLQSRPYISPYACSWGARRESVNFSAQKTRKAVSQIRKAAVHSRVSVMELRSPTTEPLVDTGQNIVFGEMCVFCRFCCAAGTLGGQLF